ncbi:TIGR03960 family B12-binding radical SAM protein [Pendulispora albinea]|uniref:TIGR03960 family B12-binding radical SAM protein n=1 Tax=Pendulispora albinea TaxID=2741071 RepID=A0ABZ2LX76_9BACT
MSTIAALDHPYASFVQSVEKPARYLGGEFGAQKKDWSAVRARVCLAFPDLYDIGMSHLGFKILYKILNDDPRTLAERCYTPWVDMQKELRERALPLVSLESARPLSDFDVVGFSLQFELTYTNVLAMLDLGRIPLRSADRSDRDPLILAGGPTATHPEPLAPFLDAVVVGDGEERATEVALLWVTLRERGVPRRERLRALAKLEGVYIPSLYSTRVDPDTGFEVVAAPDDPEVPFPVQRSLVDDLNRFPFPDDGPIGGPEAIFDRMSIEIARGCTEGCRFCQAGMIYRPVRERDPEQIVQTALAAVKKSGYDEVSLTSLSTADYSCIAPLIKKVTDKLAPERVSLGVSSLRAYGLEESVLDDIQRVRATGVTFAPEAGSQRMRDVVNKNVTEEQLMTTAERIFSRGWTSMKLYFMIGLPTEEESDVREIPRVGGRAREVGRRIKNKMQGGAPSVTVSVSTHVPKPHTPFQWCAIDAPDSVKQKQRWLAEEAKRAKVELKVHGSDGSWVEAIFARGDRKLGAVLERAYRAGARFDSWDDQLDIDVWREALQAEGVDPARYLGTIPVTARLPWDHIDVGLEEGFLTREYRKALKSRLSPPCGKAAGMFVHHTNLADAEKDERRLVCYDCGVACDLDAMRDQRHDYLTKLGAKERRVLPIVTAAAPVLEAPAAPIAEAPVAAAPVAAAPVAEGEKVAARAEKGKPRTGKKPPPLIVQGEARRYRFAYTKIGRSAFLSHLDLIRALPRAFRRCDLSLFYSSGYHPKPDMMFAPALSLGVSSLTEIIDIKLTCDVDVDERLAALSAGSPEGVDFFAGVRLGAQDPAVSRVIEGARYAVCVPRAVLAGRGGEAWLHERANALLAATESRVLRKIEGVGKWVDVRAFLRQIAVGDPRAAQAAAAAGFVGDLVPILVDLDIRPSGTAKIAEAVQALSPDDPLDYVAVRAGLGRFREQELVSPIELAHFRAPPRASSYEGVDASSMRST